MAREAVRIRVRLRPIERPTWQEGFALRFPRVARLGNAATLRLPLGSRPRTALIRYGTMIVVGAHSRGSFELTASLYADDGELRNIPTGGAAVSILGLDEVYRGPAGVRRFFEQWAEPWEHWRWAPDGEVIDLGEGRLLALFELIGRGRGSGIEVREDVALLAEFERGQVASQRNWLGTGAWGEARRVVGLG
jgi:hypothetical protein